MSHLAHGYCEEVNTEAQEIVAVYALPWRAQRLHLEVLLWLYFNWCEDVMWGFFSVCVNKNKVDI